MFIKDALNNPAHLGGAGSCFNLHEANARGLESDALDLITSAGSAGRVVPFAVVLNDGDK